MKYGRVWIFVVAAVFLLAGVALVLQHQSGNAWAGVMIRVGTLLAVIGIAWPQLHQLRTRASVFSVIVIFFMLLLIAARPRLFPLAAAAALGILLLNGLLRRFSGKGPGRRR